MSASTPAVEVQGFDVSGDAEPVPRGVLYLVPSTFGDTDPAQVLPGAVIDAICGLDGFIAEEAKSARAFLKRAGIRRPLAEVRIATLNEHTRSAELPALLQPALMGERIGLLSEAGYPAIADPGAGLVALAHEHGIRVVPLAGPSSLLLALAASGLNGQSFAFHGYLPVDAGARSEQIRALEARSRAERSAQVFIEAPYRNNQMLAALLETCAADTQLCLATELTLPTENVRTRAIAAWKATPPDLNRRPTVFVLQAGGGRAPNASEATKSRAAKPRRSSLRSGVRSAPPDSGVG
jgi:16S rRNA (cytidine1402-2'-O)-methyltransferase